MILKIQEVNQDVSKWYYFSDLETVTKVYGEAAAAVDFDEDVPKIRIFGFVKEFPDHEDTHELKEEKVKSFTSRKVNKNVNYSGRLVFQEETLLEVIGITGSESLSKATKEKILRDDPYWTVVIFELLYKNEKRDRIIALSSQDCYLLNDDGQTIERL